MAQHTVDLPCIADTYCDADNPGTNYGSATTLNMGERERYYALLKFDWTALLRKNVTDVKLRVYSARAVTGYGDTRVLWSVPSKGFNESTETYSTYGEVSGGWPELEAQSIPADTWVEITGLADIYNQAKYRQRFIDYGLTLQYHDWTASDYWQIQSREGANPPILRVTYEDVPPDKPTLLEPIGVYRDSASVIRFEWQYNSPVGGAQKKFDLQWSTNQSSWTTISETTENTYLDIPEDTFPVGNIYWRVRTYNEYDESSGYSDIAVFYSVGAPAAPIIQAVSNECRPVVEWSAFEQQIYQVQILQGEAVIYDSGDMPGISIRQYRIPVFLDDGEYSARVRIKNEYDMWSDWGATSFSISTTKPGKPVLSVQRSPYGLELTIGNVQGEAYIYRDGVPIAKVTGQKYFDHTVANGKEYRYFVRALSGNGFADSDTVIGVPAFRFGLLNVGNEVIELKHNLNSVPDKSMNCAPVGMLNHYDGRELPIAEMSDNTNITLSLTYFFKGFAKVEKIMEAARKKGVVLYRDKKGLKMYGVITNVTVQDVLQGYSVTFTVTATDFDEAVEIT